MQLTSQEQTYFEACPLCGQQPEVYEETHPYVAEHVYLATCPPECTAYIQAMVEWESIGKPPARERLISWLAESWNEECAKVRRYGVPQRIGRMGESEEREEQGT